MKYLYKLSQPSIRGGIDHQDNIEVYKTCIRVLYTKVKISESKDYTIFQFRRQRITNKKIVNQVINLIDDRNTPIAWSIIFDELRRLEGKTQQPAD